MQAALALLGRGPTELSRTPPSFPGHVVRPPPREARRRSAGRAHASRTQRQISLGFGGFPDMKIAMRKTFPPIHMRNQAPIATETAAIAICHCGAGGERVRRSVAMK